MDAKEPLMKTQMMSLMHDGWKKETHCSQKKGESEIQDGMISAGLSQRSPAPPQIDKKKNVAFKIAPQL